MSRRQAKKLEPITLDDLLGNSSMEGLVSFLDLPAHSDSLPRSRKNLLQVDTPVPTVYDDAQPTIPTDPQPSAENKATEQQNVAPQYPLGTVDTGPLPPVGVDSPTTLLIASSDAALSKKSVRPGELVSREQTDRLSTIYIGLVPTVDSGSTNHPIKYGIADRTSAEQRTPYPVPTVGRGFGAKSTHPTASGQPARKWITEDGQIVSERQVRPFRLAQDALNANERALYSVLWNSREARIDPTDQNTKIVRAGYETLAKQTNMAKKTIQRLIPRLINKNFIEVNENPNFFNRTAAAYRVFTFKRVLEICAEQGRGHVAKLGHGVAFAKPYDSVPSGPLPTVYGQTTATVNRESPLTRDYGPVSTMDRTPTSLESPDSKQENNKPHLITKHKTSSFVLTSSSSQSTPPNTLVQGLRALLSAYQIELDSEATGRLWNECRNRVPDCTAIEILHFSRAKAVLFSSGKITSPVGFLLFAVPKCFEGPSFHEFRLEQEQARRVEEEQAKRAAEEMEDVQRQLREMLNSPTSTEEDREFALRLLSER